MSDHQEHPFHLVNPSPWPMVASLVLLVVVIGGLWVMHDVSHGPIV
ncbi:MAG: cytochrome c oxidase subunit 3, partial [Rickettsiales bacterium]